jgi:hypothetical protein
VNDLWIDGETNERPARRRRRARPAADDRHIGCPLTWLQLVFPIVRGKSELAVALAIYRLHVVRKSRTITVSNVSLLAELGVHRQAKYRVLRRLAAAGIITVARRSKRALMVTFVRQKRTR